MWLSSDADIVCLVWLSSGAALATAHTGVEPHGGDAAAPSPAEAAGGTALKSVCSIPVPEGGQQPAQPCITSSARRRPQLGNRGGTETGNSHAAGSSSEAGMAACQGNMSAASAAWRAAGGAGAGGGWGELAPARPARPVFVPLLTRERLQRLYPVALLQGLAADKKPRQVALPRVRLRAMGVGSRTTLTTGLEFKRLGISHLAGNPA